MKSTIRTTYTMQISIIFILIFVSFLAVYLSFNKAFRIKNEVINFIEKYQGLTKENNNDLGSIALLENYMVANGHTDTGRCMPDYDGIIDGELVPAADTNGEKYRVCVKKNHARTIGNVKYYYYDVVIFFGFDLPVLGEIIDFSVNGETVEIQEYV